MCHPPISLPHSIASSSSTDAIICLCPCPPPLARSRSSSSLCSSPTSPSSYTTLPHRMCELRLDRFHTNLFMFPVVNLEVAVEEDGNTRGREGYCGGSHCCGPRVSSSLLSSSARQAHPLLPTAVTVPSPSSCGNDAKATC